MVGDVHLGIQFGGVCEHAVERDGPAIVRDVHIDRAAGALHDEIGTAIAQGDATAVHGPAAKRDRCVSAHRAEAGVVHEQHTERSGSGRLNRKRAIHLGVPAWFEHQAAAVDVQARRGVTPLLQHRGAPGFGETFKNQTDSFAAGVHLDGAVGGGWPYAKISHGIGGVAEAAFVDNGARMAVEPLSRTEGCPRG